MDPDTIGKVADATSEAAKAAGKAIDAASGAGRFAQLVFGDLVVDAVGLLGDRLKFYRLERWHLLAERTSQRLAAAGISEFRSVPPKVALPLIESATVEDDDNLHAMWAALLAVAMTEGAPAIEKMHVSVLNELSPTDADVLSSLYANWQARKPVGPFISSSTLTYGDSIEGIGAYDAIAVTNLNRLGLITPSYVEFKTYEPGGHDDRYGDYGPFSDSVKAFGDLEFIVFTEFGLAFCAAVIDRPGENAKQAD